MTTMFDVELYGDYRSLTFAEVFPSYEDFAADYAEHPLYKSTLNGSVIYALLYASYANSHIANSDINQFINRLYQIMYMYGPAWQKRIEIQEAITSMTIADAIKGGSAIYNHAFNDSSAPAADTTQPLDYINDQNTTQYKKSMLEGYAALSALVETDVTKEFLDKFKPLFLKVVAPELPLYYTNEPFTNPIT